MTSLSYLILGPTQFDPSPLNKGDIAFSQDLASDLLNRRDDILKVLKSKDYTYEENEIIDIFINLLSADYWPNNWNFRDPYKR